MYEPWLLLRTVSMELLYFNIVLWKVQCLWETVTGQRASFLDTPQGAGCEEMAAIFINYIEILQKLQGVSLAICVTMRYHMLIMIVWKGFVR